MTAAKTKSMHTPTPYTWLCTGGLGLYSFGVFMLFVSAFGMGSSHPRLSFFLSIGAMALGGLMFIIKKHYDQQPGIKNNHIWTSGLTSRGFIAWILGLVITYFYICLYWYPHKLQHLINMMNPLSMFLRNKAADKWFLYGTAYTVSILIMGVSVMAKYRRNRYQIIRTGSVMFFQLIFAYLIPAFLVYLNQPEWYLTYFWPLSYDKLFPSTWASLQASGGVGIFFFFWGLMMLLIATPILSYFFGKRWYCSWVCGCGGLANTLGDPWRQLSDKSLRAWKIERYSVHGVLVIIIVVTGLLWLNIVQDGMILGDYSRTFAKAYGFFVGSVFAGVIGVGVYPLLGTRVWCRFGCPMAAILGIFQKKASRFRITTNGGQCISCGNCSTYCEMGIDVRSYAQRGQDIIRASCVGCGVCSAVCPRGVLNLEAGPRKVL